MLTKSIEHVESAIHVQCVACQCFSKEANCSDVAPVLCNSCCTVQVQHRCTSRL
jgi:hypothetical protein